MGLQPVVNSLNMTVDTTRESLTRDCAITNCDGAFARLLFRCLCKQYTGYASETRIVDM